jgi:cell wall-associated NlpC family hydrolase
MMKNLLLISSVLLISGCVQKNVNSHYPTSNPSRNSYNITQQTNSNYHRNNYKNPHFLNTQIEKTAKSHLGKKYVWGANGPYTFDCSGFTKAVFAKYKIDIPRVSKEQAKVGRIIPWNYLQKGDLIFFDSKKSSRVSHVGIYLGEGKFIHASSSKHRVVISKLTSNYYSKHFKWGRRVTEATRYASR